MLSEHNPIAELVHQIQQKWVEEVSPFPKLKLVRWLIKPDEARLYEGFLKLESTEHGAIPEMLVAMLTPFTTVAGYSKQIINDWAGAYKKDTKTQEKLEAKNIAFAWNPEIYLKQAETEKNNCDQLFIEMLSDFQKQLPDKNMHLVVALFPHSVHDFYGFNYWLAELLNKELPEEISFMIFDHIGENYYDKVFEKNPETTKTLHVNLNMDDAISKIAKMGDPNSPEVKFRECILEMGKAVQKNDQPRVDVWGEKALLATQQSGLKSMFASAHLVYAGMLFTFKKFDKIDTLLVKGLHIAQQGIKLNDNSCKPLIIQFYGYMAASKQLQKNMNEAIKYYEKQGETAVAYQLPAMALMPYQQAYTLSGKKVQHLYDELLKKAYSTGIALQKEELTSSNFASIALDFYTWQKDHQQHSEAAETDKKLNEIFGADWKEQAKQTGAKYTVKKEPAPVN
jgi:hypothetical protein